MIQRHSRSTSGSHFWFSLIWYTMVFSPLQIATIDVASGRVSVYSPFPHAKHNINPQWTPDGRELWFSEVIGGTSNDLRAVDMRGRVRTVAKLPIAFHLFDIARDGTVLAGRSQTRDSASYRSRQRSAGDRNTLFNWGKSRVCQTGTDRCRRATSLRRNAAVAIDA